MCKQFLYQSTVWGYLLWVYTICCCGRQSMTREMNIYLTICPCSSRNHKQPHFNFELYLSMFHFQVSNQIQSLERIMFCYYGTAIIGHYQFTWKNAGNFIRLSSLHSSKWERNRWNRNEHQGRLIFPFEDQKTLKLLSPTVPLCQTKPHCY